VVWQNRPFLSGRTTVALSDIWASIDPVSSVLGTEIGKGLENRLRTRRRTRKEMAR
jgi:hypothetical protein